MSDSRKVLTHMEEMKFLKFSGNYREWPNFKDDFGKQVSNEKSDDWTVSYNLRNAVPDHIESLVRNASDHMKEIWQLFDEKSFQYYQVFQTRQGA